MPLQLEHALVHHNDDVAVDERADATRFEPELVANPL